MAHEELLRDFTSLPPEVQRQVVDYITFLRVRYGPAGATDQREPDDLLRDGFVGMWRDHDELRDSSAWVRDKREREWIKQGG